MGKRRYIDLAPILEGEVENLRKLTKWTFNDLMNWFAFKALHMRGRGQKPTKESMLTDKENLKSQNAQYLKRLK